jgi:hypothetical protein
MWKWQDVAGMVLVLVGLGIMAGQNFEVNLVALSFWALGGLLLVVRFLHREPSHDTEAAHDRRLSNQRVAKRLSELRTRGIHSIRNEFEAKPLQVSVYIQREAEWMRDIKEAMRQCECLEWEVSRVEDISNSEIGMAAVGADYGPDGNWLIGLMEMRLRRLAEIIDRYSKD